MSSKIEVIVVFRPYSTYKRLLFQETKAKFKRARTTSVVAGRLDILLKTWKYDALVFTTISSYWGCRQGTSISSSGVRMELEHGVEVIIARAMAEGGNAGAAASDLCIEIAVFIPDGLDSAALDVLRSMVGQLQPYVHFDIMELHELKALR